MFGAIPPTPRALGFAGLLPQAACLLGVVAGGDQWRWIALATGWGYAALIFTFLGGTWWGLAAGASRGAKTAPDWIWIAAVLPSLIALATFVPWMLGAEWPGPSLVILGAAIFASPLVDRRLADLAPPWWLALRVPLSLGLGAMTVALGVLG